MNSSASTSENRVFGSISVLIIIAVCADIPGFVFYIRYLESPGIGWFDSASWSQQLTCFKTPIGATLTFLGIGPYVILFGWVLLQKPK